MKIGLMADSHDHIFNVVKALKVFKENNVELVMHAGDFVAPFTVKKIYAGIKVIGVFGNNEGEKKGILDITRDLPVEIHYEPYFFEINDIKFCLVHDLQKFSSNSEHKAKIVIFGHTHKQEKYIKDNILFINPGESCGWVNGKATAAILNLPDMECNFFEII